MADRLDTLYRTFDHVDSATDPVHIVRRYAAGPDRENGNKGEIISGLSFVRVGGWSIISVIL